MKVVVPYYASLITFSAAGGGRDLEDGHIGTFQMEHMFGFKLFIPTVFIETEAPAWYVFIADTMPQCQMECFIVQYLILMEHFKIYMLESIHQKMVNSNFFTLCHVLKYCIFHAYRFSFYNIISV